MELFEKHVYDGVASMNGKIPWFSAYSNVMGSVMTVYSPKPLEIGGRLTECGRLLAAELSVGRPDTVRAFLSAKDDSGEVKVLNASDCGNFRDLVSRMTEILGDPTSRPISPEPAGSITP